MKRILPRVRTMKAQGATEYLILLAVVLIIALLSVALLGFFSGTAQDTQLAESQIYWKSTSPLAVEAYGAYFLSLPAYNGTYGPPSIINLRIRNTGSYPIRIRDVRANGEHEVWYSKNNDSTFGLYAGSAPRLSPGDEMCLSGPYSSYCSDYEMYIYVYFQGQSASNYLTAASTVCDPQGGGTLVLKNFGFEYDEYVENQVVRKQEIGTKDLVVKCMGVVP